MSKCKGYLIAFTILAAWVILWFYGINTGREDVKKEYIESVKDASLEEWQVNELKFEYYSDSVITWREKAMLDALKRNLNKANK